jgi:23S rRNA (adenine2503-C2)-methyltransferase
MNRKYPLADLMRALRAYPLPKRRRITIEYTLIDGVNDAPNHARELAQLLRGIPCKINLIPMNPISASELRAPKSENVREFQDVLAAAGYSCFVRTRRGDEVAAACGQLAMAEDLVKKKRERDDLRARAKLS